MANIIISPYALSFEDIRDSLQSYIQASSSLPKSWSDFYTAGAGQTVLELDAAVATFLAFHIILSRRESLLTLAQNYDSILGLAMGLGYNASRGHNLYLDLSIVPALTVSLPKWTVIGQYDTYDVILREDVVLDEGIRTNIPVVIGNAEAQQILITSNELQQFTFTSANVTDDFRLLLNDEELPTHTKTESGDLRVAELKDSMNDYYITLSNPFGAVDVFYLNQRDEAKYKYKEGDTLYLHYIARNNITYDKLSADAITIYNVEPDTAVEVYLNADKTNKESAEHIKGSAPIYHETNNIVRARKDYAKLLKEFNKSLIDVNDRDISPGLIALTYLKNPELAGTTELMTQAEKNDFGRFMQTVCPDGVAVSIIQDPVKVIRNLDITYKIKEDEYIPPTFGADINTILGNYRNKLAPSFNLDDIEHAIERISGIKTVRVSLGATSYQTNKKYKLYDAVIIKDIKVGENYEDWTFYCSHVRPLTGETVPDWISAQNIGDSVLDNNYVWENSNKDPGSITAKWKKDGSYEILSDITASYIVRARCTSSTQPKWGETIQTDGNVTWNKDKDHGDYIADYEPNKKYNVDDKAFFSHENKRAIYKATAVYHKSGSTKPEFSTLSEDGQITQLLDNALTWKLKYSGWIPEHNYIINDHAARLINEKLYVYVARTNGKSGPETRLDGQDGNPLNGEERIEEIVINPTTSLPTTIIWELVDVLEDIGTWAQKVQYQADQIIESDGNFYYVFDNSETKSGLDTEFYSDGWKNGTDENVGVEDNNVKWELVDNALTWLPDTPYEKYNMILVRTTTKTYKYEARYVVEEDQEKQDIVYSVATYAGTTGANKPEWTYKNADEEDVYYDNVEDNDILWTKVSKLYSEDEWEPGVTKYFGDVIKVAEGVYYTFSSVLGTSGNEEPNWLGIQNNKIVDNNITWTRITDISNIYLQWNEYLDLTYSLSRVDA